MVAITNKRTTAQKKNRVLLIAKTAVSRPVSAEFPDSISVEGAFGQLLARDDPDPQRGLTLKQLKRELSGEFSFLATKPNRGFPEKVNPGTRLGDIARQVEMESGSWDETTTVPVATITVQAYARVGER
jgi:hypothetical protein